MSYSINHYGPSQHGLVEIRACRDAGDIRKSDTCNRAAAPSRPCPKGSRQRRSDAASEDCSSGDRGGRRSGRCSVHRAPARIATARRRRDQVRPSGRPTRPGPKRRASEIADVAGEQLRELMDDRFLQLLGRGDEEPARQVEAHLVAEDRTCAGACAVVPAVAVIQHRAQEFMASLQRLRAPDWSLNRLYNERPQPINRYGQVRLDDRLRGRRLHLLRIGASTALRRAGMLGARQKPSRTRLRNSGHFRPALFTFRAGRTISDMSGLPDYGDKRPMQ